MDVPIDVRLPLSSDGRPLPPTVLHPHHLHIQMCGDVTVHHKLDLHTYKPHVFILRLPRDGLTYAVNTLHVWVENRSSSSSSPSICKPTVTLPCPTERAQSSKLPLKSFAYEPLRGNIGAYVSIRERHDRGICGVLRKVEYDEQYNSISVVVEDVHNRPGTFGLYSLETEFEVEIEITPVLNDDDEYYDGKEPRTGNTSKNIVLDSSASRQYTLWNGSMNSRGSRNANIHHGTDDDDIDAPYASILVHGIDESIDPSQYGTLHATFQTSTPTKRPTGQAFDVIYNLSVPGREPPSTTHAKRQAHMEVYALLENPLAGTVDVLENITTTFQITAQDVDSRIVLTHVYETDRIVNGGDMLHLLRDTQANNGKATKNKNTANTMELELAAVGPPEGDGGNGGTQNDNNNTNNVNNNNSNNNNDGRSSSSLTSWTDVNRVVDSIQANPITKAGNKANPNTRSDTYTEFKANLSMPEDIIFHSAHPITLQGRRSQRVFLFEDAVDMQFFHMYAVNTPGQQPLGSVKVYAHIWRHEQEVVVPGIVNMCFPEVSGRNMKGVMDRSGFANLEWKFPAISTVRASQRRCVLLEHECELTGGIGDERGDNSENEEVREELAQLEDGMGEGIIGGIQHLRGRKVISSGRPIPPPVSIFEGILTKYLPQKLIYSVFLRNEGDEAQYIGIPFMKACHDHVFRSMNAMRYASFDAAAAAFSSLPSNASAHPEQNKSNNKSSPAHNHHARRRSHPSVNKRKSGKQKPPHSAEALDILERQIGVNDHVVFTKVDAHDECVIVITIRRWTESVTDVNTMDMHDIEQLALWDDVSDSFISRLYKMHDAREHTNDINRMQIAAFERCMATRDACIEVVKQVGVPMGVQYGDDDEEYLRNDDVKQELMRHREKIRRMCDVVDDAVTHHGHLVRQAWRSVTAAEKIRMQMYNVPYEQISNGSRVDNVDDEDRRKNGDRVVRRVRAWSSDYQLADNDGVDTDEKDVGDQDDGEQVSEVDENEERRGEDGAGVDLMHYRNVMSRRTLRR